MGKAGDHGQKKKARNKTDRARFEKREENSLKNHEEQKTGKFKSREKNSGGKKR